MQRRNRWAWAVVDSRSPFHLTSVFLRCEPGIARLVWHSRGPRQTRSWSAGVDSRGPRQTRFWSAGVDGRPPLWAFGVSVFSITGSPDHRITRCSLGFAFAFPTCPGVAVDHRITRCPWVLPLPFRSRAITAITRDHGDSRFLRAFRLVVVALV